MEQTNEERMESLWLARNKAIEDSARTVDRLIGDSQCPDDPKEALRLAACRIRLMLHSGYASGGG